MSQPRLHQVLTNLFDSKDISLFTECLLHEDYGTFMNKHGLNFPRKELVQAFIHTSFSHEFNVPHQEKLEFLGDSVLQFILTEELFKKFPNAKEGQLSKIRSSLVNEKILAQMARGLGLNELILVGKGEFKKNLFEQSSVLADSFEALLAQVYQFQGLEFTKSLLLTWINKFVPGGFEEDFLEQFDVKSKLQEKVLAKYKKVPRYTSENKGDEFQITLWIDDAPVTSGIFSSKKIGEKELASEILKKGII